MTAANDDVSTFTLDVYWAAERPSDPPLEEHIAACLRCRTYLENLDSLEQARSTPGRREPATSPQSSRKGAARWAWSAVATGVALAAAVLVFARGRAAPPEYVGTKGTPAVQILVHRASDTRIWDGRSPIAPGDALAIRVACEGLEHVAIASPGATGWERITDAACPTGDEPLPFTLVVDGAPGDEQLAVVLSRDPLDDDALRSAVDVRLRSRDVWTSDFALPKETAGDR